MKKKVIFNLALLFLLTTALTSCTVSWGSEQYEVPWYILTPPLVIFCTILFVISTRLIMSMSYRCSNCEKSFHPKWHQSILSFHIGASRFFKCPHCGHRGLCHPHRDDP